MRKMEQGFILCRWIFITCIALLVLSEITDWLWLGHVGMYLGLATSFVIIWDFVRTVRRKTGRLILILPLFVLAVVLVLVAAYGVFIWHP